MIKFQIAIPHAKTCPEKAFSNIFLPVECFNLKTMMLAKHPKLRKLLPFPLVALKQINSDTTASAAARFLEKKHLMPFYSYFKAFLSRDILG